MAVIETDCINIQGLEAQVLSCLAFYFQLEITASRINSKVQFSKCKVDKMVTPQEQNGNVTMIAARLMEVYNQGALLGNLSDKGHYTQEHLSTSTSAHLSSMKRE